MGLFQEEDSVAFLLEFFLWFKIQSIPSSILRFLHNQGGLIIAFSIIMILFGLFCLSSLCFYSNDIKLCIAYIKRGMKILLMEKGLIVLIPVFILLLFGLVCLFGFQTFAIWSSS